MSDLLHRALNGSAMIDSLSIGVTCYLWVEALVYTGNVFVIQAM
ncbi:MAG: hypothetical protein VYD17_08390 [Pseudomonadota bacterium]|nr:hypothetical protein [Pseudomonadota bacterium]MED5312276.1 hypothetical protein [Pseudomonadota bacterium]